MSHTSSEKQIITETITPNFEKINNVTLDEIGDFIKNTVNKYVENFDLAAEPLVTHDPIIHGGLMIVIKRWETNEEFNSRHLEYKRQSERREQRNQYVKDKQKEQYAKLKQLFELENSNNI